MSHIFPLMARGDMKRFQVIMNRERNKNCKKHRDFSQTLL